MSTFKNSLKNCIVLISQFLKVYYNIIPSEERRFPNPNVNGKNQAWNSSQTPDSTYMRGLNKLSHITMAISEECQLNKSFVPKKGNKGKQAVAQDSG